MKSAWTFGDLWEALTMKSLKDRQGKGLWLFCQFIQWSMITVMVGELSIGCLIKGMLYEQLQWASGSVVYVIVLHRIIAPTR